MSYLTWAFGISGCFQELAKNVHAHTNVNLSKFWPSRNQGTAGDVTC